MFVAVEMNSHLGIGDDSVRYMCSWKIKVLRLHLRVHVVIVCLVAILCKVKCSIPESTHSNCVTPSMENS
jgi:hypothetical protein